MTKSSSNGNPLVQKHSDRPEQTKQEHDTNHHQHNSGTDFNEANVLTEPFESGQELVKEEAREQERYTQPQGID